MVSFKFKIGDILCHRAGVEIFPEMPAALFVTERGYYEGLRGSETIYLCRIVGSTTITTSTFQFDEGELMEYPRDRIPSWANINTEDLLRGIKEHMNPAT